MKSPVYEEDWSPEVKSLFRHDMQEIWDPHIAPQVWNQYRRQLERYIEIASVTPRKILDVGCAQATLALKLAELGHEVTALDIRPEFIEYAKTRYTHGNITFLSLNVLDASIPGEYDLIFANQIIEHLVYPESLVAKLCSVLRPGGRIVITTPNGDYVRNDLPAFTELGDRSQWQHLQFTADSDGHFYAYKKDELVKVFAECGLRDINSYYFESPAISGNMKIRYLHGLIPYRILKILDNTILKSLFLGKYLGAQIMISGKYPGPAKPPHMFCLDRQHAMG